MGPPPARRRALRRVHRREAPLRARGGGQAGRHAVHVRDPGRHLPAVLERRGLGLRVLRQRQRGVLQLARRPLPRRRGSRPPAEGAVLRRQRRVSERGPDPADPPRERRQRGVRRGRARRKPVQVRAAAARRHPARQVPRQRREPGTRRNEEHRADRQRGAARLPGRVAPPDGGPGWSKVGGSVQRDDVMFSWSPFLGENDFKFLRSYALGDGSSWFDGLQWKEFQSYSCPSPRYRTSIRDETGAFTGEYIESYVDGCSKISSITDKHGFLTLGEKSLYSSNLLQSFRGAWDGVDDPTASDKPQPGVLSLLNSGDGRASASHVPRVLSDAYEQNPRLGTGAYHARVKRRPPWGYAREKRARPIVVGHGRRPLLQEEVAGTLFFEPFAEPLYRRILKVRGGFAVGAAFERQSRTLDVPLSHAQFRETAPGYTARVEDVILKRFDEHYPSSISCTPTSSACRSAHCASCWRGTQGATPAARRRASTRRRRSRSGRSSSRARRSWEATGRRRSSRTAPRPRSTPRSSTAWARTRAARCRTSSPRRAPAPTRRGRSSAKTSRSSSAPSPTPCPTCTCSGRTSTPTSAPPAGTPRTTTATCSKTRRTTCGARG